MEGPSHQVLLPTSVPVGSYYMHVGGEMGALCVLRAEKQPELLAGNGLRGQGLAGDYSPKAHQPSASGGGAARGAWER